MTDYASDLNMRVIEVQATGRPTLIMIFETYKLISP